MKPIKVQACDWHSWIWGVITGAALLTALLFFPLTVRTQAQTLTVLHRFTGKGDGKYPLVGMGLIRDARGNLYGTTSRGGSFNMGAVFKIDAHGNETILHSFWGGDGWTPAASLILDAAGNLYGTTFVGGTPEGGKCTHGCGTVFKLDPSGHETVLYAFSGGADGGLPQAALIQDASGSLYGTTTGGGGGCGVVFKLDENGKETVLHGFTGPPDGCAPIGGLVSDEARNLYGVTYDGGTYNRGTVFKLDSADKETVLYSFTGETDGSEPGGPLVRDAAGNLYGAASGGDPSCQYKCGVVFKVTKTGKETVLYAFKDKSDGSYPAWGLIQDRSGNLYGAAEASGSNECFGTGCGTIFKVDKKGNETVLYSFSANDGSDGWSPNGGLIMDKSGNLYGTTDSGGAASCRPDGYGCGVVFKLAP